jgi:hypothetical protein
VTQSLRSENCVVRSIAIATSLPYQQIYDLVNGAAIYERTGSRKRGESNARTGTIRFRECFNAPDYGGKFMRRSRA